MAITVYCEDSDMQKYRPNILQLGVSSWQDQREEAFDTINRVINARWYRKAAVEMGYDPKFTAFDPDLVMNDQLTRLASFKSLELAYMYLKKDGGEEDGFERAESSFRKRYNEELNIILAVGIDYDWDGDDVLNDDEYTVRVNRRLVRS